MQLSDQSTAPFEAMFIGYAEASNRFESAAKTQEAVATYVALFEALNWAVALDDRTAAHFAPDGAPLGWGWRERIPSAEIMAGVRYARNSVHHQWSDAVRLEHGRLQFPVNFPLGFFEWVWRPADELPAPGRPPSAAGERIYRDQMEGRAARVCLDVLGGVFLTLQRLLEPHTIQRGEGGFLADGPDGIGVDAIWPPASS